MTTPPPAPNQATPTGPAPSGGPHARTSDVASRWATDPAADGASGLAAFIDASPSPYHAAATAESVLVSGGWTVVRAEAAWEPVERGVVRDGGGLVAWSVPRGADATTPMRIVGAHTDSPNLRVKPRPDTGAVGIAQLGVEVYGGALLNSWLDRDLGLSGRVALRDGSTHLVRVGRPVLRVSQLAIHLDREVNDRGLLLDRQRHLAPMWTTAPARPGAFVAWIAQEAGVDADEIGGWDLMVDDLTPSRLVGADESWLAAPRIDNLASCHAGVRALVAADADGGDRASISVLCLFDHEEVGSMTATGAQGAMLPRILARLNRGLGGDEECLARAAARSVCISADGAHATHPNYVDRHEPDHPIRLDGGPVIKHHASARYATDAGGSAIAEAACIAAGVPFQHYVNRSDLPCGSTIGPVTSSQLGIPTVDMGIAQLSMHSARELCGAGDPSRLSAALAAFLR